MFTERLELRLPVERDRDRFVELFTDDDFMVFSAGVHTVESAHERFDGMLARATEIPFAKQPIIERSSGLILGYTGVNTFEFEGETRLEWGWRLVPEARGTGYATEATLALLGEADRHFDGEILAMIDPRNLPSQRVADKVGFAFWKEAEIDGYVDRLYRLRFPRSSFFTAPAG